MSEFDHSHQGRMHCGLGGVSVEKPDKLLVALRTRAHQLFELYVKEEGAADEEESLVESYRITEEFVLKGGRRLRITDNEKLQEVTLFEEDRQLRVKRAIAGYVVEALDGSYTACRTLTDEAEHLPLGERERPVLFWALDSIKWLIQNAPAIVGE